ncbi:MAG: DUF4347 domain-containing protein, partial [bacterium]|nr:DUF4347 domain-containing protein [bacterium]
MARRWRRQKKKAQPKSAGSPKLEALEPRVLLSTFTVAPDGESLEDAMRAADDASGAIEMRLDDADPALTQAEAPAEQRVELAFVDTGVAGYEALVDDLRSASPEGRSLEVFLLDAERDGVEQISDILTDYQGVDAIHIVSHGTEGAVQLGDTWLSGDTLSRYESDLQGWADALSEDADLLFYGCELAGGESGGAFVNSLSKLTGADVAASTDDTGHAILGGDWDLEHWMGQIETSGAFSAELLPDWGHLLNVEVDASISGIVSKGPHSDTISHSTSGT